MTEQLAITLLAASVGFCAAIFFCVGNALNTPKNILRQSGTYWDFSEPMARSLSAQRAQYIVGALLLIVAFSLQVLAAVASPTTPAALPQYIHNWLYLVASALIAVLLFSSVVAWLIYKATISKVLLMEAEELEEEERRIANSRANP